MKPMDDRSVREESALLVWQALVKESRHRPWLAGLLARRGAQIFGRFIETYRRLRDLPRRWRRRLGAQVRRGLATTLLGAALLFALGQARPVHAATIVVDGTTCALADAITAANTNTATNGCAAGDAGEDTLDLQTGVTLGAALPELTSEIVLDGNGNTIDGDNAFRVLHINDATVTVQDVTISNGDSNQGAGVLIEGASADVLIENSTISGNTSGDNGGGVYVADGIVTINNTTISNNSAPFGGGGVETFGGETVINNSTIIGNDATSGGGVDVFFGPVTINNSTISGNTASSQGGGIANLDVLTVNNSTITGNTAPYGGGLYTYEGEVTLNRTIISGNTASNEGDEVNDFDGSAVSGDNYNVFGYGGMARSSGFTPGATDVVPSGALNTVLDTTLSDNGGPTQTHALVVDSPATDLAPDADCNATPIGGLDQRGYSRNVDGDSTPSSNECDAGAFEFGSGPTAIQLSFMSAHSSQEGGLWAALGAAVLSLGALGYRLWTKTLGRGHAPTPG